MILGASSPFCVRSFDVATCTNFDAHHFARPNEQRNLFGKTVLQRGLLPGTVLLRVHRRRGPLYAGFGYGGQTTLIGSSAKNSTGSSMPG
jgi:hypothetical protein